MTHPKAQRRGRDQRPLRRVLMFLTDERVDLLECGHREPRRAGRSSYEPAPTRRRCSTCTAVLPVEAEG